MTRSATARVDRFDARRRSELGAAKRRRPVPVRPRVLEARVPILLPRSLAFVLGLAAALPMPASAQTTAPPPSEPVLVDGLEYGETATMAALGDVGTTIKARVHDGHTGAPIEGATVRVYAERIDRMNPLLRQAVTDAAGVTFVPRRIASLSAEKTVVTAPGYAPHAEGALSLDGGSGIALWRSAPVRGRVLDLDGRPIPRAVVSARNTCAHDTPGVEVVSDVHGRFVLDATDTSTWSVSAPGHGGFEFDLTLLELRREEVAHGSFDLYLPARRPLRLRVLDGDAEPVADERLSVPADRPILPAVTGADGVVVYGPIGDEVDVPVFHLPEHVCDGAGLIAEVYPRDATITLSPENKLENPNPARATVRLRCEGSAGDGADLQIADSDGVLGHGPGTHDVAAGEVVVTVGRRFSGEAEFSIVQTLEAGSETEIVCPAEREAELTVRYPDEPFRLRFVQADDDSMPLHANGGRREPIGEGSRDTRLATVFVPVGTRVVAFGRDDDGDLRRAVVERAEDGAVLDLARAESVFRRGTDAVLAERPTGRVVVRAVDDRGEAVEGFEEDGQRTDRRTISGPDGTWVGGSASADDHVSIDWRHTLVGGQTHEIDVMLPRAARVTVLNADGTEQGTYERTPGRCALWLDPDTADERSLYLELNLEPGVERTIRLLR